MIELIDCVFCDRIGRGECDATSHPQVVSFEPLNPVVPGHRLFVPRYHSEHREPWGEVAVARAAEAAAAWVYVQGLDANVITSVGDLATQTIPHIHVHVVPRNHNDGLALPWSPK